MALRQERERGAWPDCYDVANERDLGAVCGSLPDDLGDLAEALASLRTGEALVLGDALQVPSRIRVRLAAHKPQGSDPALWRQDARPDPALYADAVRNWRIQSTSILKRDKETK